jgi:hypothetical protein
MIKAIANCALGAGFMALGSLALAQAPSIAASWGLYTYPREGQNLQKMQLDEGECIAWARNTTGVDPNNPGAGVQVAATPDSSSGTGVAAGTGAVKGAAKAGLIGNVAGKSGSEWAAYGAVIGAARGAGRRQAQNDQAAAKAQADAKAQTEQRMKQFLNAFTVCMDGRNYTVSGG